MIVKTKTGYQVKSESGKPLSKPNLTKEQAKERIREVEYYKNKNKWNRGNYKRSSSYWLITTKQN